MDGNDAPGATRVGSIDGLRGLAIAGVLAYHVAPGLVPGGFLGVEVFFVLSGYLLASLAFAEHQRTGRVDWRRYAARRLRRIGPALGVLLFALILLVPIAAHADAYRVRGDVLWSAAGLTNWHLIGDGSSYFARVGRPPFVRHLWSLGVELQFYACVPLLVGWLARRRATVAAVAVACGIVASSVRMAMLYQSSDASRAYYGTDARAGALLTGVLVAVLLRATPGGVPRLAEWGRAPWAGRVAAGGLAGISILFLAVHEQTRLLYPAGFLACRLAVALLIAMRNNGGRVTRTLGARAPRWLGERSFGIYLWYWPLLVLLRPGIDVSWPPALAKAVAVGGAIVLGHLSFVFVERPVNTHFRPQTRARLMFPAWTPKAIIRSLRWSAAATLALALVTLVSQLPTINPVAQSLVEGQRVVASQPSVFAATTSTVSPPTTRPPVEPAPDITIHPASLPGVELSPGPPPNSFPVTALGDSVMLGAAGALRDRLGSASVYIDAKVSRQFAQGVQVARRLRDEGRLGQVVIVHLGTNGPPRRSDIDALMDALDGVRRVVFVTVRVSQRWEGDTNQTLREAAGRFPRVVVADWYTYSDGHHEWFQSDGTHLKASGATAYADVLAAALPPPDPPTTTTSPPQPTTTTTTAPPAPVTVPTTTSTTTSTTTLVAS